MFGAFNRLAIAFACLAALCLPAAVASELIAPSPDWVIASPQQQPKPERLSQVSNGLYFLVLDRQVRWDPEGQVSYRRVAYKITDRLGLEDGAKILMDYDPSHEGVAFHKINILRDGQRLSRLEDTPIRTYRREAELNSGIVDGHLTAHADVADVRVGDIVEYELSVTSAPQLGAEGYDDGFYALWQVPVAYQRFRASVPAGQSLQWRAYGVDAEPQVTSADGLSVYEWIFEDLEPIAGEAEQPGWNIQGGVLLTTTRDWSEVSRLLAPHYLVQQELPPDFRAKIDDIARTVPGRFDRITEVLRLVQDSIRYVGNEIGPGAYIPRPLATTLRNGFGDCKDKTVLLIAALRHLGIDAVPALVHLSKGHGIGDRLPSLSAFNHVIAQVREGTETYWLDPTLSHQGGRFPDLVPPDYGFALPISESGAELIAFPEAPQEEPGVHVKEAFVFPSDGEHVRLGVETIYTGRAADSFRWQAANTSESQLERNYFDYYEKRYPGLEQNGRVMVSDDRDTNRIVVEESYRLGLEALAQDDFGRKFPLSAYILEVFTSVSTQGRTQPVLVKHPVYRKHDISVTGLKSTYIGPERLSIDNDHLSFDMSSQGGQGMLAISWQLRTKQRVIEAADVPDYMASVRKVSDILYWTYDFQTDGSDESADDDFFYMLLGLLVLVVVVPILVLIVLGLRFGLRADAEYRDEATFFPVSLLKFSVMSVCTLSLYSLFWMWKFWRWQRLVKGVAVMPFWRTVFAVIWLYPTFRLANSQLETGKVPTWIGVVAAIWLVVTAVASGDYSGFGVVADVTTLVLSLLSWLAFLPAVVAVNRLNGELSYALEANSKFNGWNITGIVIGSVFLLLIALGIYAGFTEQL